MKIGVVLQARMGSSRLPGKVLMPIGGEPLLAHIFDRMTLLRHPVGFILATSDLSRDDMVEAFCREHGVECFRGSEQDVLERYYVCAARHGFDHIIRLTGDNPFVDVEELDRLIDLHLGTRADYSHSFDTLPVGCGAEIFTFEALEKSYLLGTKTNHREHVNEYIQENPNLFRIASLDVPPGKNRPDLRLTVDTDEDYHRACHIAKMCCGECVTTERAVDLCLEFEKIPSEREYLLEQ